MRAALSALIPVGLPSMAWAQPRQTGFGWSGLPAVNYDSDEGFGYGVTGGLYQYGEGSHAPYAWALEATVFFTTNGHNSASVFYDAPDRLGHGVRLSGRLNADRDCCQPYYGLGNAAPRDTALLHRPGLPNYYSYRRDRLGAALDVQWSLPAHLRVLAGAAAQHNAAVARDTSTLFAADLATAVILGADAPATALGPRVGLVYDTRDAERDPRQGLWLDALAWEGVLLSGGGDFTRFTATVRGYVSPVPWLTFAARVLGERWRGAVPLAQLADIGSSFQDFTGIGGAESVRGVLRLRYLGRARALANVEVRWRGPRFRWLGAPWQLGAAGFVDAGRVWDTRGFGDGTAGLHWGKGAGLRLAWGPSFIIAADFAYGAEAGLQTYLKLGQMF
jgi:outer membrane protein assembly factor BamA